MKKFLLLVPAILILGISLVIFARRGFVQAGNYHWYQQTPSPSPTATPNPCEEYQLVEVSGWEQEEPCETPEASPSPTPEVPVATPYDEPDPKGPPEWADPCFYIHNNPGCATPFPGFPGENGQGGVRK